MKHVLSLITLSLLAAACDHSGHDADTTSAAAERAQATRDDAAAVAGDRSAAANDTTAKETGYRNSAANEAAPANDSSGTAGAVPRTGMGGPAAHEDGVNVGHTEQPATATGPAPDNTRINERDRDPSSNLTPLDQGTSEADRTITQRVRQGIVGRDDLSMTAENVKIITIDGIVTLRGPVKTPQEKSTIDTIARQVSGVKRVDNQLEIASR